MHGPGTGNFIGIGHANVSATVISKIQIVVAKRALYPIRHLDQRRSLDIASHSFIHIRRDDGPITKTGDLVTFYLCYVCYLCCVRSRKPDR